MRLRKPRFSQVRCTDATKRSLSASVTFSPISSNSSTIDAARAVSSTASAGVLLRPIRARSRISSSVCVISVMVSRILLRWPSSSTASTRTLRADKGVLRSCPIAPSITSFSSSIAVIRPSIALCALVRSATSLGPRKAKGSLASPVAEKLSVRSLRTANGPVIRRRMK